MFITIDPYYDVEFFHKCESALANNSINYNLFIDIRRPNYWYFQIDRAPIMVNYNVLPKERKRYIVPVVRPIFSNEKIRLYRRFDDKNILKYINNDALENAYHSDYACFFECTNKEELMRITRKIPIKIWYIGRYKTKMYKVGMACDPVIENVIPKERILLRKTDDISGPGEFEAEFGYRILSNKEYFIKYTQNVYFENGEIYVPPFPPEPNTKMVLI